MKLFETIGGIVEDVQVYINKFERILSRSIPRLVESRIVGKLEQLIKSVHFTRYQSISLRTLDFNDFNARR